MNRRITLIIFLIFCQPVNFLYAQTVVIDSLRSAFSATVSERDKLGAAVNLLDEYESLHTDTILRYYNISQNLLQRNFSEKAKVKPLGKKIYVSIDSIRYSSHFIAKNIKRLQVICLL